MTYPRAVTARLLDVDGTTIVAGDPLENSFDRRCMDEVNGPGSGSISLPVDDPGAAELTPGRFVQILVEGTVRFTFQIEGDPEYKILDEGEEHDQIVEVGGRGWACVLDQGIVYPSNLTLNLETSWRLYSFASPDFPNAGAWVAADELYEYLEGVSYPNSTTPYRAPRADDGIRYNAPIGYPFPRSPNVYDPTSPPGASYVNTYWIWPPSEELSVGYAFFRRTLTIPSDGFYTFTITADNFFTLFLEGIPILGEDTLVGIWKYWKEAELFLEMGTYQIGVMVQNPNWSAGVNPGGLLMNVFTLDGGQWPDTSILVTDDNWICDFDANLWPGWTPGQITDDMTTESSSAGRDAIAAYAGGTFTGTLDSDGNSWGDAQDGSPYIPAFAVDVGSTIMAALEQMVDEGHVDWHMRPGTCELDMWAQDETGTTPGVSLQAGVNLRSLNRGATNVYANSLLVQWERGFVQVLADGTNGLPDEITAFGTAVEDIYSSQASSENEAIRQGVIELERRIATGWPAIVATVEPTSTSDCPYEGFTLFDTVTVPAVGGGTENVKVLSIDLSEDEDGNAIWVVELNRRWRNVVRDDYGLLRQIGGRSGRGYGVVE